jgi:hypothetical protein
MNVKIAFLQGDLKEKTYTVQPERFSQPGQEHLVCKFRKSLDKLKQRFSLQIHFAPLGQELIHSKKKQHLTEIMKLRLIVVCGS